MPAQAQQPYSLLKQPLQPMRSPRSRMLSAQSNPGKLFKFHCPECLSEIDLTSIHGDTIAYPASYYNKEPPDYKCRMGCPEVKYFVLPELNLFAQKRVNCPLTNQISESCRACFFQSRHSYSYSHGNAWGLYKKGCGITLGLVSYVLSILSCLGKGL